MVKPILKLVKPLVAASIFFAGAALLSSCATSQSPPAFPPTQPVGPLEKKFSDDPNDREVNLKLGEQAERGGELLRAEQYYLRAEALGVPTEKILPRLLSVLVKAQRYEDALDRCKKRLGVVPQDRETRFLEAALLVAVDRAREAERDLMLLAKQKPEDPEAYLQLGRLYRDEYHDRPRAKEMFGRYLALAPNAPERVRFEVSELDPVASPAPVPTEGSK